MDSDALDEALRALAHPERRRFLQACQVRQCSAGELAEMSALSIASVSEHLKVLRKSRLLVLEIAGRFWLYRTDPVRLRATIDALAKLEELDGP
jgi:DNA-binding transcriptional ArsR family regulator